MTRTEPPKGFELREDRGVRWLEARSGDRVVVFSLRNRDRLGPEGAPADLDMGRTTEAPDAVRLDARRSFCEAIGIDPGSVRIARQVHGDRILDLDGPGREASTRLLDPEPPAVDADGFLLAGASVGVVHPAIVTADCLPVAIEGTQGVALLHLGWRGLATRLLEEAVERTAGKSAVLGPAIGPCCYEVGPEVFEHLGLPKPSGNDYLDLVAVAAGRLSRLGLDRILDSGLCTSCEEDLLFSHRRDGEKAGRHATVVFSGRGGSC